MLVVRKFGGGLRTGSPQRTASPDRIIIHLSSLPPFFAFLNG